MTVEERKKEILKILDDRDYISVKELSTKFNVSEVTMRHNIDAMERDNLIARVHGGIVKASALKSGNALTKEYNMPETQSKFDCIIRASRDDVQKASSMSAEKESIAKIAGSIISSNDTIFLDHTTTSQYLAYEIVNSKLNCFVLTNSLSILSILKKTGRCLVFGGEYDEFTNSFAGEFTLEVSANYKVQKAFISPKHISIDKGFTVYPNPNIALLRQMCRNSDDVIILADSTKFSEGAIIKLLDWKDISHIITDREPARVYNDIMKGNSIKLLYDSCSV